MTKIQIYTQSYCGFCVRAKTLLQQKGIAFEEINLDDKPEELLELKTRTGFRTIPQIFVGGRFVGGFQELAALESSGELQKLLTE